MTNSTSTRSLPIGLWLTAALLALLIGCGDGDIVFPLATFSTAGPTPVTSGTPMTPDDRTPDTSVTPMPPDDETPTPTSTVTPPDCLPDGAECLLPSDCCSGRCASAGDLQTVCEPTL